MHSDLVAGNVLDIMIATSIQSLHRGDMIVTFMSHFSCLVYIAT